MADPGELAARLTAELDQRLAEADAALARATRGSGRGGSRCTRSTCRRTGTPPTWSRRTARRPGACSRARRRVPRRSAATTTWSTRVLGKLDDEPVEDLRVDFEDGYGGRADDEEDADVGAGGGRAGGEPAGGRGGAVRRHPVQEPRGADPEPGDPDPGDVPRGLLDQGGSPEGWVVTLPKVTSVAQVEAMVPCSRSLDLRFEIQVETPQAILGPDGTALVARMIHAGGGPADRPALRHLRLLGVPAASPRPTRASSTRPPTTPRR